MGKATVRNISDSYVRQSTPTKNYGLASRLYVGTGFYSYIYFGNPIPLKAKVVSAKLVFFSAGTWAGSVTASTRLLNAKWSANKITWNNDPGLSGPAAVTQTKSGATNGTRWELDITTLMQAVANGQKWYGLQLTAGGAAVKGIFSAQAAASRRPYILIEWSDAPLKPADLIPRNGQTVGTTKPIFNWDFVDVSGSKVQSKYRLQIATSNTFSSILYDTETLFPGGLPSTQPQHDTTGTAWTATASTIYYWRVMTWDGAGMPSPWSDIETFQSIALGTVTMTSPSSVSPLVKETTPLIGWTPSVTPQESYQVLLYDDVTNALLWDSGRVDSTNTYATVPAGKITKQSYNYRVEVRSWDDKDRITIPGFPTYATASQVFTYVYDASVGGVTSPSVAFDAYGVAALITVFRSTVPDYFTLVRNDVVVASNLVPVLFQDPVDPTKFIIPDYAPARQSNKWQVIAVVNGVSSSVNPNVTQTLTRKLSWLCSPDGDLHVGFMNPAVDTEDGDSSEVMQGQDGPPALVTQNLYGEFGSFSGRLRDLSEIGIALTGRTMKNNLRALRSTWGGKAKFMFQDESWDVFIHHVKIQRLGIFNGSTEYDVSFDFFQV